MKFKSKLITFLICIIALETYSFSQDQAAAGLPEVTLFHGKVIDVIPYSRKFFLTGELPHYGEWVINKVSLEIYNSDKNGKNDGAPFVKDEWIKMPGSTKSKLLVDKGLKYGYTYQLEVTYDLTLEISEETEINYFTDIVAKEIMKYGESESVDGNVTLRGSEIEQIINDEYNSLISKKFDENKALVSFTRDKTTSNFDKSFKNTFSDDVLSQLNKKYSSYFLNEFILQEFNEQLVDSNEVREDIVKGLNQNNIDTNTKTKLENKLKNLDAQIEQINTRIAKSQQAKKEAEESIDHFYNNEFEPFITSTVTYGSEIIPSPASVDELETIRVGTVFGGGVTWLNPTNDNYAVGFGYLGLKFHLQPVDKRLIDPYIGSKKFLNRLSFLVGFGLKSDHTQYHGQKMKPLILNTYPMLGLSVDCNRYISIDAGTMFFMYDAISPLEASSTLRLAPFLTLSFDIDLFNRFSALFKGEPYSMLGISTSN